MGRERGQKGRGRGGGWGGEGGGGRGSKKDTGGRDVEQGGRRCGGG